MSRRSLRQLEPPPDATRRSDAEAAGENLRRRAAAAGAGVGRDATAGIAGWAVAELSSSSVLESDEMEMKMMTMPLSVWQSSAQALHTNIWSNLKNVLQTNGEMLWFLHTQKLFSFLERNLHTQKYS
jgi:hypothetical protein